MNKTKRYVSLGENKIEKLLLENEIPFKREFIFSDLRGRDNKTNLRFDFAILDGDNNNNIKHLIEYDGFGHHEPVLFTKEGNYIPNHLKHLSVKKVNDEKKNQYCKDNNIKLIRIPYTKYKEITLEMLL